VPVSVDHFSDQFHQTESANFSSIEVEEAKNCTFSMQAFILFPSYFFYKLPSVSALLCADLSFSGSVSLENKSILFSNGKSIAV
jgi:hypothetical protein